MNIRDQLRILTSHGAAFVVVGGQAGVLRQAIEFSHDLDILIERTEEPLLQTRLIAAGLELTRLTANPSLHPTAQALLQLDDQTRGKLLTHPARFATFLARVPLILPPEGYRLRAKAHTEST